MAVAHAIVGNYHTDTGIAKTVYHAANKAGTTFAAVAPL